MPASSNPKLTALRTAAPAEFHKMIVDALKKAKGVVKHAARTLGISERTMVRYVSGSRDLQRAVTAARKAG